MQRDDVEAPARLELLEAAQDGDAEPLARPLAREVGELYTGDLPAAGAGDRQSVSGRAADVEQAAAQALRLDPIELLGEAGLVER